MTESEGTLAEKLETLFDEVRKPDGSKFTQAEVVEGTNGVLTRVYLWKLRTGRATNPGFHIIKALADFFHVDTNYFSQSDESAEEKEKTWPTGRYFEEIQARVFKMDDKARKTILDMMDYIVNSQNNETPGDGNRGTEPSGKENPE